MQLTDTPSGPCLTNHSAARPLRIRSKLLHLSKFALLLVASLHVAEVDADYSLQYVADTILKNGDTIDKLATDPSFPQKITGLWKLVFDQFNETKTRTEYAYDDLGDLAIAVRNHTKLTSSNSTVVDLDSLTASTTKILQDITNEANRIMNAAFAQDAADGWWSPGNMVIILLIALGACAVIAWCHGPRYEGPSVKLSPPVRRVRDIEAPEVDEVNRRLVETPDSTSWLVPILVVALILIALGIIAFCIYRHQQKKRIVARESRDSVELDV